MTHTEMMQKIEANKGAGVGVEVVTHDGCNICYYYEDFDESKGIDRAMRQIYLLLDAGKFVKATFVA